jgi:hypothetical protein
VIACGACGIENPASNKFCGGCGATISGATGGSGAAAAAVESAVEAQMETEAEGVSAPPPEARTRAPEAPV